MANFMDSILVRKPGWSKFPLTHEVKTSIEFGKITPFFVHETTPGEKLRLTSEVQLKFSPLISPVMHRINLFTNYFYVPYYTIWSAYEDFFGGGREGDVICEPPYLTPLAIVNLCMYVADFEGYDPEIPGTDKDKAVFGFHHSWFDYIGIPLQLVIEQFDEEGNFKDNADDETHLNMLPLMACWKAYHDYFQDENLDDTFQAYEYLFNLRKEDWISNSSLLKYATDEILYTLPSRAWEHDYFTSALPWAQRGEQVEVPLAGNAPVTIPDQEISLREVGITFRNPSVTYNGGSL
ncbi:MAG: major capsid protein, partial [Candidatus Micrarchaeia archaeon]